MGAARPVLRRWLLSAASLVLALVAIGAPASIAHADKSFSFDEWDASGILNADGSLTVTERLTYRFDGGPFSVGIRSFERGLDQVTSFAVADDRGPLEVTPPGQAPSGQWEWSFRSPLSDTTTTFTLTYVVRDLAVVGRDVGDANWEAIGPDHPRIARARVAMGLVATVNPAPTDVDDADASVLRAFGHGAPGLVRLDVSLATYEATDVDAGSFMGLRVVAPSSAFTASGSSDRLPTILAEERALIDQQNAASRQDDRRRWAFVFTPIVLALGAVGLGGLWARSGREQRSTEVLGEYWREPLDDPPAIAITNLQRGTVDASRAVAGTLVDLAQRGYLTITATCEERFGPDRTVHHYQRTAKQPGTDIRSFDRAVLDMVFRDGATATSSEEMQDWARGNQGEAKAALDRVTKTVKDEFDATGYERAPAGRALQLLIGVCAAVAVLSVVIRIATGNGVAWFGVFGAAMLLYLGLRLLSNRSAEGVDAAAKAAGLRRYLRDFSRLQDAPIGHLILWERYLVYAVALGVSAELVDGMAVRVPQVLNDPAFSAWYIASSARRFDGFDAIRTSSASFVSASTPNTSGAGGASVGGGGGVGFGGGGAGAR